MHMSVKLALATAALASAGLMGVGPAQAVAEHCPDQTGKVEINGGPTVSTGLAPGTEVCFKAGNFVGYTTVAADGTISNTQFLNPKGNNYLGISYYVPGECTDPYGCEPTGS